MVKACGLRIGPRRFELFVLDGSPKKPKVLKSIAGEIPPDESDPTRAAGRAIKAAIRAHKLPKENLEVVIDARSAAFRRITLPVTDPARIESVIKFEVEAQLPQFSIDDVIVDFHVQDTTPDSSSCLVTAVPKEEISRAVEICAVAGLEPLDVEVETTALVNAASGAGLCAIDGAQILVHVGEESTAVAVVDGGKVREMRVIQIGALSYTPFGTPPEETAEPGDPGLDGDGAEELEELDELAESRPGLSSRPPRIERAGEIVQRLRRELSRTISASRTANELGHVYLSGFELPGLVGSDVLGIPVESFESLEIEEKESGVHTEYRSGAIAYGAALRRLGGGLMKASLRREELKFTGAMERLELPLAVLSLLIVTFLGVWHIFLQHERQLVDWDLTRMVESTRNYVLSPSTGLAYPPDHIKKYLDNTSGKIPRSNPAKYRVDPVRNRYDQLLNLRRLILAENRKLKEDLGQGSDLTQPQSALRALTLVLDLLARGGDKYGRVSLRRVNTNYQPSQKQEKVRVDLSLAFFAASSSEATKSTDAFYDELREQPWYVDVERASSKAIVDDEGDQDGVFLDRLRIDVDVSAAKDESESKEVKS